MNQFLVPQFLEVEDKIIGPITTRQFVIMLVTFLILFIVFKLADFELFIIAAVVLGGFSLTLSFAKIKGQSFHFFLLNVFQNFKNPSRRIWKKDYTKKQLNELRKGPKKRSYGRGKGSSQNFV